MTRVLKEKTNISGVLIPRELLGKTFQKIQETNKLASFSIILKI